MIAFAITLLLLPVGSPSLASEPEEILATEVIPIEQDEPAPFTGLLFPEEIAIKLGDKVERCQFLLELNDLTWAKRIKVENELCDDQLKLNAQAAEVELKQLQGRFAPWVVALLGGVAGMAVIVIGAWTIKQVS